MRRAVHQFTTMLEPGAVGNHMVTLQQVLRDAGYSSEIFTLACDPRWEERGRPTGDYGSVVPMLSTDVLIYQYAIGSPMADLIQEYPGVLVVNSHTQTPAALLGRWQPGVAFGVTWGMRQLTELGPASRLGIAVSEFNAEEMRAAGFRDVTVVPVFTRREEVAPDSAIVDARPEAGTRWLFVGRVSPNKMQQRIVQALAWYRQVYDPNAELVLVGSGLDSRYGRAVRRYISDVGLEGAVTLTGSINESELAAYYATADVFVCLSEHEGFCVPLLEAMRAEVPIVAKATSAIPETLGSAGILLQTSRPSVVAAAVHRVITDSALRASLIAQGTARAETFAVSSVADAFLQALEPVFS